MTSRRRLDSVLVERGLAESREKARRAVMAGEVRVAGKTALKPSQLVGETDSVSVDAPPKYVSRGGLKLEHALDHFGVDPGGRVALDIGASTGGFTDCLLQRGARLVHAVDVGQGQIAWKLRQDPRVRLREKTNARHLKPGDFDPPPDLVCVDVSFISLALILPAVAAILPPGGTLIALVEPQFEAGKTEADKGRGVIRDPLIHTRVVTEIRECARTCGLEVQGTVASPIRGADGNIEFLLCAQRA